MACGHLSGRVSGVFTSHLDHLLIGENFVETHAHPSSPKRPHLVNTRRYEVVVWFCTNVSGFSELTVGAVILAFGSQVRARGLELPYNSASLPTQRHPNPPRANYK